MGKSISTLFFLYLFLISFVASFLPKAFYASVKRTLHFSVVLMAPIQKWTFLNTCIKRFGKKDVMDEIKK